MAPATAKLMPHKFWITRYGPIEGTEVASVRKDLGMRKVRVRTTTARGSAAREMAAAELMTFQPQLYQGEALALLLLAEPAVSRMLQTIFSVVWSTRKLIRL